MHRFDNLTEELSTNQDSTDWDIPESQWFVPNFVLSLVFKVIYSLFGYGGFRVGVKIFEDMGIICLEATTKNREETNNIWYKYYLKFLIIKEDDSRVLGKISQICLKLFHMVQQGSNTLIINYRANAFDRNKLIDHQKLIRSSKFGPCVDAHLSPSLPVRFKSSAHHTDKLLGMFG